MKPGLRALLASLACIAAFSAAAAGYISSAEKAAQIQVGVTTAKDLEAMFGAPLRKLRFGQRDVWEYEMPNQGGPLGIILSITIEGGVVRNVTRIRMEPGV
jgi:hypothetical protein